MSSIPKKKKRRSKRCMVGVVDTAIPDAAARTSLPVLPAQLWAKSLDLLFFDEVLNCSLVNKFFLQQVTPRVKVLFVRQSSNLLGSAVRKRFGSVEQACIYTLIREIGPDHFDTEEEHRERLMREEGMSFGQAIQTTRYRHPNVFAFDNNTVNWLLNFITDFPKLKNVFVGGLCTCQSGIHESWGVDKTRYDLSYSVENMYNEPNHARRMASLIRQLAEAYSSGVLKQQVSLQGILTNQRCQYTGMVCAFRLPNQSENDPCSICHLVCEHFPPMDIMQITFDDMIPCVTQEERMAIALRRDPETIRPKLTDLLVKAISNHAGIYVNYPPNFDTHGFAMTYGSDHIQKIDWLISSGANPRDVRIRKVITEPIPDEYGEEPMGFEASSTRRAVDLDIFRQFLKWNMNVSEADFNLVNLSDPRTNR